MGDPLFSPNRKIAHTGTHGQEINRPRQSLRPASTRKPPPCCYPAIAFASSFSLGEQALAWTAEKVAFGKQP